MELGEASGSAEDQPLDQHNSSSWVGVGELGLTARGEGHCSFFLCVYFQPHPVVCGTSLTRDQTCAPCVGKAES